MAKPNKTTDSKKIIFGVRRKGKHKKTNGPKEASQKRKYRGQGR